MNSTLLIVLVEVIFILSICLSALIFLNWKRKKTKNTEFEKLLKEVTEEENSRKTLLIEYLTERQHMETQAALELSEDFIAAEKEFMYQFLDQQLKQKPLTGFYENLSDLLDKYLDLLPEADENAKVEQSLPEPEIEQVEDLNDKTKVLDVEEVKQAEEVEEANASDSQEEELDWGAAFSESGDEMDESVRQGYEAETGKEGQ